MIAVATPALGTPARASVAVGYQFACGVASDGTAYCWGGNDAGQLGDGTIITRPLPAQVATTQRFTAISAWDRQVCAISSQADVYCWGRGYAGDGTPSNTYLSPVRMGRPGPYKEVVVGDDYACALAQDGSAHCWGDNSYGELGNGTTAASSSTPTLVARSGWITLTAGNSHTCSLTTDGAAWCWGRGEYLGRTATAHSPVPIAVETSERFTQIGAGTSHTCGLTTAGEVSCWGLDHSRQLGNGPLGASRTPVRVVAGNLKFKLIEVGHESSCAITTTDQAYCWGRNSAGELGNGGTVSQDLDVPTLVTGGLQLVTVSTGEYLSCGLKSDGQVWCWGSNDSGSLGQGIMRYVLTPVPITGSLLARHPDFPSEPRRRDRRPPLRSVGRGGSAYLRDHSGR